MKKTIKTPESRARAPRRGRALPEDACPACGTMMSRKRGRLHVPVNGEVVAAPPATHLECPACGEIVLEFDVAQRLGATAVAAYRQKHRYLSSDQIRSIRRRHQLSQAELARLLRLGANTISRWESDRNAQTGVMDVLLRMIRDLPGTLDWLRGHAA